MLPSDTPEDVAATFCATLVDEWIECGVRHAVIAPGSRSTPMALALTVRDELAVHVFHDERAASFAALGIGLTGAPAILLCTSGTAAAHFHAAVVEAHQSAVPMLVCTADRPPELRDVGAPQTIDQTALYGSAVRWFHDPGVADIAAFGTWRSLAAHAFTAATSAWPGPVHLNLPFREPLVGKAAQLPARRRTDAASAIGRSVLDDEALTGLTDLIGGAARGVIVAGRGCGDPQSVRALALATGWPVLADARSGVRAFTDVAIAAADHLLRSEDFASAHAPDIVVRLGEPPASKVLNRWLVASDRPQVHVTSTPTWTDPDGVIDLHVTADVATVCRRVAERLGGGLAHGGVDGWLDGWLQAESSAQAAMSAALDVDPLTEPAVARRVATLIPTPANLVVSSSMPVRDVEWFGVTPQGVAVYSNRGANGIDGVVSTAIGVGLATGAPTALLIGDVAFLHDSSALIALAGRSVDVRIVVVDNDGGGIFSFLPQASSLAADRFELLFGTPHGTDIVALAAAHGLRTSTVRDRAALAVALQAEGPSVTVVPSDRAANVAAHAALDP